MRAAVIHQWNEPLVVEDVADPAVPDDGVVIRILASGVCRSDWHAWVGHWPGIPRPHVLGHEMCGTIVAAGPRVRHFSEGDVVIPPFSGGCGVCQYCQRGQQQVCEDDYQPGFYGWGSFAEYVAIPRADVNLVRLPEHLDPATAAALGCRFMTSFHAVIDQGRVRGGEWVAVHGCGGIGLSATMIAKAVGANVVAIDLDHRKLDAARVLGADAVIDGRSVDDVAAAVRDVTGGGAHVSLDAVGAAAACRNSILSLRRRGRHVQVGLLLADDLDVRVPFEEMIGWELEIIGSHGMQTHRYDDALRMIAAGGMQPSTLIGDRIDLAEASDALAAMGRFEPLGFTVITSF